MKKRLLLTALNHKYVVVDITAIKVGEEADRGNVPWLRFAGWDAAADYLRALQADEDTIEKSLQSLRKASTAVVTII